MWRSVLLLPIAAVALACSAAGVPGPPPAPVEAGWQEEGEASWYGAPFHGEETASGEIYDMEGATAAHPSLPFGTVVHVRNLDNGRETTLRVNDRGPFVDGRILDVSRKGARELGLLTPGTAQVRITVVEEPER